MKDLQMLGNSLCEFCLVSTYQKLVPLIDPKVHLFENSLLKIMAQLYCTCCGMHAPALH